ncbi:MAG: inositol monophosphatase family protein [Rickettsiales bacterium]|nr:inositol monophosphatase family protein [Rickettsiales bacterium]
MPAINSANLNVMIKAAENAAHGIRRDFGEVTKLQISRKGTLDFVTQTDLKAEKIIKSDLSYARPKYGFLLEEGGEIIGEDRNFRWVVDPIDGTTNFIHAIPYLCISIALEKRRLSDGAWVPVSAVIYDPIHGDCFIAEEGKGAFLNDGRIEVSKRDKFDESLLITHSPKHDRASYKKSMQLFLKVTEQSKGIRTMGATALDLAYIAAGKYDAGWYTAFKRWDISAGLLLAKEAGAEVTQLDGDDDVTDPTTLVVGTPKMHKALLNVVKPHWIAKAA